MSKHLDALKIRFTRETLSNLRRTPLPKKGANKEDRDSDYLFGETRHLKARGVEPLFGWHLPVTHKTVDAHWSGMTLAPGSTAYLAHLRFLGPELVSRLSLPDMSPGYRCRSGVGPAYFRAK